MDLGFALDKQGNAVVDEAEDSATSAADGTKTNGHDRRRDQRREPNPNRESDLLDRSRHFRALVPRSWPYLTMAVVGAICLATIFAAEMPSTLVIALLAFSLAGNLTVGIVYRRTDGCETNCRIAGGSLVAILPLFTFGLALSLWDMQGNLGWDVKSVILICVGSVAGAYLWRVPGLIVGSQLAIWSPTIFEHLTMPAALALILALLVAIRVSVDQMGEQNRELGNDRARQRAQTRARDILQDYEQTGQGWFWETDRRSQLTYVSEPVAKLMGRAQEQLVGVPLADLFNLSHMSKERERTLTFHLSTRSAFQEIPVRAATPGEERWWSVSGRPIFDDFGNFAGFRGSGTDLTEKRRSQESATRLALYDSLTGLANRLEISQAVDKILTAPLEINRSCAVMLLDLDRFKQVNDTMGHPAGDALLKQVAYRLERVVGESGKVGRLGGDEFQVVLHGRWEAKELRELAQEIIANLSQAYSIEGQRVVIGASVGIATAPEDGVTRDDLVRKADLALYAAKDGGRGRYHFYDDKLHAAAEVRSKIERNLRDAITRGELQLHYQPVVSTATETISGFEALLRWDHPEVGWVPPDKFVGIAEDIGLIEQIGAWALHQACMDLAKWPSDIRCAVNVSPLQFANPKLPSIVEDAISQANIDPARLELEITESVFLNDSEGTDRMFAELKKVGVRLALDDFGTGYASLGYLKKAPFDKIKIDQSFVRGATQPGSRNGAIIASITSLAQALGMDTTAEGVESMDELDLVKLHGCSHVQGFIYERPLCFDDATERLAQGLAAAARGPRVARGPRQSMLRGVLLEHNGQCYNGKIRNLGAGGALIEGLWNVPPGTEFTIHLSCRHALPARAIWAQRDQMGVAFEKRLEQDYNGHFFVLDFAPPEMISLDPLRKAG